MAKNVYIGASKQFSVTNLLDYNALSGNDGGYWGQYTFGTRYVVWSPAAAPTGGHHSLLFNQNFSTGTAKATYQLAIKTGYIKVHLIPSHKYYFSVYLRQPSVVGSFDCYWPIAEPPVLQGVTVTAANTWQKKSTIVDRASFSEGDYEVRVDFNNPTTGSSLYVSNLVLVDLTATFGAGGEPNQAWCDANLDFNDTASDSAADTATITATGSVARRAKNIYIGVGGKARKVKKAYVGVGGKARLFYTSTLPPTTIELWNGKYVSTCVNKVYYANGYYVAIGSYNKGSGDRKNMLAYTSDLSKGFTSVELAYDYTPYDIIYANGYWVIACYKSRYAYLFYATSLNGTWKKVSVVYNKRFVPNSLCYANGYWVIGGTHDRSAYIFYATDLKGPWTDIKVWDSGFSEDTSEVRKVIYADGYWVAAGFGASNNPTYEIAYTTSLNETWTTNSIYQEASSTSMSGIFDIVYANGVWACAANKMLLYSNDIMSSSWTSKDIGVGAQTAIIYADGYWVVVGSGPSSSSAARIGYSSTLAGNWIVNECFTSYSSSPVTSVAYGDGYYLFGVESEQGSALVAYAANPAEFDQF